MPSQRQRKAGYLLPENVLTDERFCVSFQFPDTPEYRAAVRGAVFELGRYYVWERTSEQVGRYQLAALVLSILEETYCERGCCPLMLRQSDSDPCVLEQSTDGGANWTFAFDFSLCLAEMTGDLSRAISNQVMQDILDAFDGTVGSVAPDMVYSDDGNNQYRDAALCVVLRAFIGGVVQMEKERRARQYNTWDSVAQIMMDGGVLLSGTPLGWLSLGLFAGAMMLNAGAELFRTLDDIALNDEEAQQDVACCMFLNMAGASPTESAWNNSLTGCGFGALTTQEYIRQAVAAICDTSTSAGLKLYLAFLKQLLEVYPLAQQGYFDDCPCGDWCYLFDLGADQEGWYEYGLAGTFTANGLETELYTPTGITQAQARIEFDAKHVYHIEMTYDCTKGTCTAGSGCPVAIKLYYQGDLVAQEVQNPISDGSDLTLLWEGDELIDMIEIAMTSGNIEGSGNPGGSAVCTAVEVWGTNLCPFGDPNCEQA